METQGDHVKFVYHKDGGGTHAMRFAHGNESAENNYGYWVTPDIASWYQLKGGESQ
ncbi:MULTISPECIES: NPP1 family protein [Vibrio]|uniref:NPP1 family protein n=1 Tax=Vibrio sp. S234-5 TaxID=1616781 RepID=UPI002412862E|nr:MULTISPECIES: NPP1 family protein [Vibrio]